MKTFKIKMKPTFNSILAYLFIVNNKNFVPISLTLLIASLLPYFTVVYGLNKTF